MSNFSNITKWLKSDTSHIDVIITHVALLGGVLYFFFTITSALVHPGGIAYFGTFMSELGSWKPNGYDNVFGYSLFLMSAVTDVVLTSPFWFVTVRRYFNRDRVEHLIAWVGAITGPLSAISFLISVLYPIDIQYKVHIFIASGFSVFSVVAAISYTLLTLKRSDYPHSRILAVICVIYFVGTMFYMFPIVDGAQKLVQKTTIYLFVVWSMMHALIVRKKIITKLT